MKRFLQRKENFDLLPGCGWLDGGCRSLMKAMRQWLGEEFAEPFQIAKTPEEGHSEHAFVKVGDFFLDGDGASSLREMEKRWRSAER